jgi:hypothetical protein
MGDVDLDLLADGVYPLGIPVVPVEVGHQV